MPLFLIRMFVELRCVSYQRNPNYIENKNSSGTACIAVFSLLNTIGHWARVPVPVSVCVCVSLWWRMKSHTHVIIFFATGKGGKRMHIHTNNVAVVYTNKWRLCVGAYAKQINEHWNKSNSVWCYEWKNGKERSDHSVENNVYYTQQLLVHLLIIAKGNITNDSRAQQTKKIERKTKKIYGSTLERVCEQFRRPLISCSLEENRCTVSTYTSYTTRCIVECITTQNRNESTAYTCSIVRKWSDGSSIARV